MITIDKGIVSRWKIDTHFENWLSFRADHSRIFKRLYVEFYAIFDRTYYRKGKEMASKTMADFHAEKLCEGEYNEKKILRDMLYCLHRFGFSYDEYFLYELYDKNTAGKEEFISEKMRYEYYYQLNGEEGKELLRDKGRTYNLLGDFFKRNCVVVSSEDDYLAFQKFINDYSEFIYKPIGLDCGRGVKKVNVPCYEEDQFFKDLLQDGAFILEEIVCQSETMAKLHRQSVNTVRIPTVICQDGVNLLPSFLRMGRGDSTVDNVSAGGIFASVDPESGIVISKAAEGNRDNQYIFHPDTQEKIIGFQLPEWDKAIWLVRSMATVLPNIRYVAWDLAHTDEGWVLVEANGSGRFSSQKADKIGIKHEFLKLMENM